jgi:hypothetical protein
MWSDFIWSDVKCRDVEWTDVIYVKWFYLKWCEVQWCGVNWRDLCEVILFQVIWSVVMWSELTWFMWSDFIWSDVKYSDVGWTDVIYVKWFYFEVKWVTVTFLWIKVLCTLGWPYTEGTESHGLLIVEALRKHHSRQNSSGRVISPSQISLPDNIQQSEEIAIHAPAGIRTRNLNKRTAADSRLKSRSHWVVACAEKNLFAASRTLQTQRRRENSYSFESMRQKVRHLNHVRATVWRHICCNEFGKKIQTHSLENVNELLTWTRADLRRSFVPSILRKYSLQREKVTQATELQRVRTEDKDNTVGHERALVTRLSGVNMSKWCTVTTSPCLKGIIRKHITF